jgi:glycosyltransferase involved in cell wall biosynthesis
MSPANVRFLLEHNPSVNHDIVEVCPNSIAKPVVSEKPKDDGFKPKYKIPSDAVVFLYGGNLGRPQGISFLVDCLRKEKDNKYVFFMIVGNGSEAHKVKEYVDQEKPANCIFLDYLPKEEYQKIADQCDVGMIFLDYHFTIPNFPSRVLNYLSSSKPILAATDPVCDMGDLAEENGFGVKCLSNDVDSFSSAVNRIVSSDRKKMGENAWKFFCDNYTVEKSREIILSHYNAND